MKLMTIALFVSLLLHAPGVYAGWIFQRGGGCANGSCGQVQTTVTKTVETKPVPPVVNQSTPTVVPERTRLFLRRYWSLQRNTTTTKTRVTRVQL